MILECKVREGKGKEYNKKLRREKNIPGIIYGSQTEPVMIYFKENEFLRFMRENKNKSVLRIKVDGEEKMVVIKDKQERPWKNQIMHVDFQEIHKGETISLVVPIHFIGVEEIEKRSLVLVKNIQELEIECKVEDIPNSIDIDVSNLEMHHSIHLKDIPQLEKYKVYEDLDKVVCSVTVPRAQVVGETEEGAEGEGAEGETSEEGQTQE